VVPDPISRVYLIASLKDGHSLARVISNGYSLNYMQIKRIAPQSLGRIVGVTYAILGLIGGLFFSLISIATQSQAGSPPMPIFFGVGAVVFLPILYGLVGFIGGLFVAWLYNIVAERIGGIEIDIQ
jgi:hypothetical protein